MVMKGQKNPHKIIKVRSLEYRESLNNADYGESKYRFKRKTMLIRDKWFWQMGVMDNFSYPLCNRIEPRSSVSRMHIFIVDFSLGRLLISFMFVVTFGSGASSPPKNYRAFQLKT